MILAAEFLAILSSAVKIASERRYAILVLSVFALFSHFFHTFSEFFPQDFPLQNKGL